MTKEEIIKMKISRVEKEIRDTPYDKSSEHHHGVLKAKLAKLQDELSGSAKGGGGGGGGYAIKHSGDASVVLVGLPSVGKSSILNLLTNAESKVGNYDFTTLGIVPGMLKHKGVRIQILDAPGIIEGASEDKGFGKKVLSVIRAADMVILMTDVNRLEWLDKIGRELENSQVRLGKRPPKINIKKTGKGGIQVIDPYKNFDKETVVDVMKEMGHGNAIVHFGEKVKEVGQLIDVLSRNVIYMPVTRVVNKVDLIDDVKKQKLKDWLMRKYDQANMISGNTGEGIEDFKESIWLNLGLIRVYLKRERSKEADRLEPMIMKRGQTLNDVLAKISQEMREDVNRALIWGKNAKFAGQQVSFTFPVFDEMEVWFGR